MPGRRLTSHCRHWRRLTSTVRRLHLAKSGWRFLLGVNGLLLLAFLLLLWVPTRRHLRTPRPLGVRGCAYYLYTGRSLPLALCQPQLTWLHTQLHHVSRLAVSRRRHERPPRPQDVVFVTAASGNHITESLANIATLQRYLPHNRIVFYDLGLSRRQASLVKSLCRVEYKSFNFDMFPRYVRNLEEYRWKPLIVLMTVAQHGVVQWVDTSVRLQWSAEAALRSVLQQMTTTDRDMLLYDPAEHSNTAVSHPGVYLYLPMLDRPSGTRLQQYGATTFTVTAGDVSRVVLHWWATCALHADCQAPPGAALRCQFDGDRWARWAGCHRYDQTVLNILLQNTLGHTKNYTAAPHLTSAFLTIQRNDSDALTPLCCDGDDGMTPLHECH